MLSVACSTNLHDKCVGRWTDTGASGQCDCPCHHQPSLGGLVKELLGCQWGRGISHPDDLLPCNEQAVQIVVLHDGDAEVGFKFCAKHRDLVLRETEARP